MGHQLFLHSGAIERNEEPHFCVNLNRVDGCSHLEGAGGNQMVDHEISQHLSEMGIQHTSSTGGKNRVNTVIEKYKQ